MTQASCISSAGGDIAVRVRGLEKGFGQFQIHKGLNLDIPRGKVTYIMGGSGCGKSLLLKQIMGFLVPDRGTIEINGETLDARNRDELKRIRKNMGILFQNGALFDSLSVYNNVAFSLKEQLNLSKAELDQRVEELLTSVGLTFDHSKKMPGELSGGQRKRVALARAIALKPSIMMYDEPTTGLDPLTTMMVTNLIKDVSVQHKLTSVVISHDTHVVFTVAEHIAFMKDGAFRYVGPPWEVFDCPDPDVQEFFALEVHRKREN
jgi:phospholipid/cholesterol/gamma-HCH transport system ATP-binding protein